MQGRALLLVLSLPFLGFVSLACVPPPNNDGKAAPNVAAGSTDATAATTATGDAAACTTLAEKICEQAGKDNPNCGAAQKTTALLSPKACEAAVAEFDFTVAKLVDAGKVCAELADRLCKDIGPDTQTCKMIKDQTPRMPQEQCQSMNDEYEKVLGELERMEAKNKPLPADKVAKMAAGDAPSFGPADATVTVVEFSDFQCPYCSLAATALTELKPKYGDRVRFVFRQFPLSFHQQAHLAGQASLAANAQGKFWEYHDKLFANQKALDRESLEKYAEEIGLDMAAFRKALDEGTYKDDVDAEMSLGSEVFVDGTPTMFVNGVRVGNATDVAAISAEIDKALGS